MDLICQAEHLLTNEGDKNRRITSHEASKLADLSVCSPNCPAQIDPSSTLGEHRHAVVCPSSPICCQRLRPEAQLVSMARRWPSITQFTILNSLNAWQTALTH